MPTAFPDRSHVGGGFRPVEAGLSRKAKAGCCQGVRPWLACWICWMAWRSWSSVRDQESCGRRPITLNFYAEFLVMRSFCFTKLALRLSPATRVCTPFMEIHLCDLPECVGVSVLRALGTSACARTSRRPERATPLPIAAACLTC